MSEIITRSEARARGLKRYFTGNPCIRGHVAERMLFGGCVDCMAAFKASPAYKEQCREYSRRYRAENPDVVRAANIRSYAADPDHHRERRRAHRVLRPDLRLASKAAGRARKMAAIPADWSDFDAFVMQEAASACRRREAMHGEPFHIDHLVPLSRGGMHCATNVQVIPARLNLKKGSRMWLTVPGEWVAHA